MTKTIHSERMKPLNIMAFLDGRPGHEKQTKSVLTAIARMTPIHVIFEYLEPGRVLKGISDWIRYIGWRLTPVNRPAQRQATDLVIGTGTFTHIPMVLYKNRTGSKAVTCMSPAYPLTREFDLCLVPHHDRKPTANNIFVTIGPPISPSVHGEHDPGKGLILVGGVDKRSHRWHSGVLLEQIQSILAKETQTTWTISSSPRTPVETIDVLEKLATVFGNTIFFKSQETPAGWVERQYGRNDVVWVTADSISMIFESISAGCRVGVLPVDWKYAESKFERCIDYLIEHQWVTSYENWHAGTASVAKRARLDEAARCAKEILQRWWPDRLR